MALCPTRISWGINNSYRCILSDVGSYYNWCGCRTCWTCLILCFEYNFGPCKWNLSCARNVCHPFWPCIKNWAVRSASEVEQNIVSVERILHQTQVEPEAPHEILDTKPDADGVWPSQGAIEFRWDFIFKIIILQVVSWIPLESIPLDTKLV